MKFILAVVALAAFVSFISAQNVTVGYARLRGTTFDSGISGSAVFTVSSDGSNITITLNISGITYSRGMNHGVHIHSFGDLSSGNGASVGAHWNPLSQPHGCPENGTSRHTGDTGNWLVDADGNLQGSKTLDLMSLMGSTSSIIGFGMIIHNGTDNCLNETSSGARLAWGVIGVANPANYGGSQNLAYPISTYGAASGATSAVCVLTPASSQGSGLALVTGTVYFTQTLSGTVQVSAQVYGLADTKPRGIHIHQWGDMSSNDGTSAGPHYTGAYYDVNQTHGIPSGPRSHHVGDLGNILVYDVNGTGLYYGEYDFFTVFPGSSNLMEAIIGRAVVIHNNTDDCTGTNGNSGPRVAYGVIGYANPAYAGALTQMTSVNSTQNIANCPGDMTTGVMSTAMETTSTSSAFVISASFAAIVALIFA